MRARPIHTVRASHSLGSCLAGERNLYCRVRLTNGREPRRVSSLKRGERLNGVVALNGRLSVGSLVWGHLCGRLGLYAIVVCGRTLVRWANSCSLSLFLRGEHSILEN